MYLKIRTTINALKTDDISDERRVLLQSLINYINLKISKNEPILLNFICTHNSRRSHLSQIWAQTLASYFGIPQVHCYSGGTAATAMFSKIGETLTNQGFKIIKLSDNENPIYAIKHSDNDHPSICFSKTYDTNFNPTSGFGAVMTCDTANEACPMVVGAEKQFSITYEDPKKFDDTPQQDEKYTERSIQIATELYWVFSNVK